MRVRAFAVIMLACSLFASPKAQQASPIQKQDKAGSDAAKSDGAKQPATPARVTIDGPVTVVNQPDPKEKQREAQQRAQTDFDNSVQKWTLFFVGVAAAAAIGAWFANHRSAKAAEDQIVLLKGQITSADVEAAEQRRIANDALVETRKSADAAKASADALKNTERAYIGLVHWLSDDARPILVNQLDVARAQHGLGPLGPDFDRSHIGFQRNPWNAQPEGGQVRYKLELRVVNNGRTPAYIHWGKVRCAPGGPMAVNWIHDPHEGRADIDGNYLHASGEYLAKLFFTLTAEDEARIKAKELWLVGLLLYTDIFLVSHELGFCRRVIPMTQGKNNLIVDHSTVSHNYDREVVDQQIPGAAPMTKLVVRY
jgi:hypothetical protein